MDFIYIWHDGRYKSKVILKLHVYPPGGRPDIDAKVMDIEFSCKGKKFCTYVIATCILSRPFKEFYVYLA